jgi:GT2 family glycosyltransferase
MNDDQSLIANVIVLPYNEKQYLEACLSSLLDLEMPEDDYEVIYADNSSTDGSADFVAEHFPTVRVLRFEENYGLVKDNNQAA